MPLYIHIHTYVYIYIYIYLYIYIYRCFGGYRPRCRYLNLGSNNTSLCSRSNALLVATGEPPPASRTVSSGHSECILAVCPTMTLGFRVEDSLGRLRVSRNVGTVIIMRKLERVQTSDPDAMSFVDYARGETPKYLEQGQTSVFLGATDVRCILAITASFI